MLGMVSDVKERNTMLKIKLALQYGTYSMAFTQLIMLQTQLNLSSFPLFGCKLGGGRKGSTRAAE